MPTKRKRYMITETEPLARAINRVRPLFDPGTKDATMLAELFVAGADARLARTAPGPEHEEARRALRERLVGRVRNGERHVIDEEAALAVRERGWSRYEQL